VKARQHAIANINNPKMIGVREKFRSFIMRD
jgi:hypothetical protein